MIHLKPTFPVMALVVLVNMTSYLIPAQAQLNPSRTIISDRPNPPPKPPPEGREPAGTRGSCENTEIPFTPLLPLTDSGFSGFTLTGHPTFWFYIPYKTSTISSVKFSLEDSQKQFVYETRFQLSETPSFVSVSIPSAAEPLEKNKQYRWTFMLYCDSQESLEPDRIWHQGLIQRVDRAGLETQLQAATFDEKLRLYVNNEIWYDASTDLAQIRSRPEAWANLLKAMGLEELEQE
ncbi:MULTISPECIES: DUF928 domain-containing protein [unclassified Coleofasciculus]|uniref:DUF928 domain-containing protein n=1 Tax=unclassified Coleofasciculus TaxID=2692782 RepID=UPI00187EE8E2|nr:MULTISPECIES: DUF928 domain-containing protein [unclassified Coleofasciculus]MBE9124707.1 DUF928 domain-containing protein [Coleofasciculus sp. LEGE 07081]MBE9147034.1 DUF928 domain-containing protein [Coleofasciculus sp. LEGE 07092]